MAPRKPLILCVDDEENPLYFRKLVLEKSGFDVVTANSGKRALELLSSSTFDLVLSDILMPGMPGTELARRIKQDFPTLPVVLVSGVNEIPPEAAYANLFVSKLEGPVILCQKISALLPAMSSPTVNRE